jgi:hypothetical protein
MQGPPLFLGGGHWARTNGGRMAGFFVGKRRTIGQDLWFNRDIGAKKVDKEGIEA